jgi:Helicase conserved C-terminal domain
VTAHLREHPRREAGEVQERDVLLRRHVVTTVRRHDLARESTRAVTRDAQRHRAYAFDAVRARDEPVALIARLFPATKEQLYLGGHHALEDIPNAGSHLRHDLPHRQLRRLLKPLRQRDDIGDAELPHYLLMRCVSEMKRGKGRSALGTALTGCYSTLLQSADGKAIQKKLGDGVGRRYLELLLDMVTEDKDADHPKVRAVLDATVRAWRAGEKTLLFCFRTHTAKRLQQLLDSRIEDELHTRRDAVLGGAESLKALRSRFTRRDGDLVTLGLDRVLWSLRWAAWSDEVALPELIAEDLRLTDNDLELLARLALVYEVDLRDERVDRVFVHRAVEHLIARRLRSSGGGGLFRRVLDSLADEAWVRAPYGLERSADDGSDEDDPATNNDAVGLDERGVHAAYASIGSEPSDADVRRLADDLRERRERARRQGQVSVFDAYAEAPSFWLGSQPEALMRGDPGAAGERTLAALHVHLLALTRTDQTFDWTQRRLVLQGLRRALMRESVLLRILPGRSELTEGRWGDLLVERFFASLPDQRESLADRLAVFVEDLQAAAGPIEAVGTARNAMYEATRMRDTGFVVLVDGSTLPDRRERVFAGFNSPLLPEVLICTSVGQEGIDLHRHCRNVIHYDLAWNPAVLEQRTGRVDRIGSKTFRERAATDAPDRARAFLDVGVPFLAGTYDERMYEEIRIRAQTFEVLTGGNVAADGLEGGDDGDGAEGKEVGLEFPVLPPEMIRDLRVRLHVWESAGAALSDGAVV